MFNLKPEIRRFMATSAKGIWRSVLRDALGKSSHLFWLSPWFPVFHQCANLAAPSLPALSSDQVRAVQLHHRFSCCSYSSPGNILLIHMTKRRTTPTVLVHLELFSACLPPVILQKQDASLVLITLSSFHPSSILRSVLPHHARSLYIPVSSLCLAVLCVFSGRI